MPVDEFVIPTGRAVSVNNSPFDFREFKILGQDLLKDKQQLLVKGYDHSFVLEKNRSKDKCVAELLAPDKKIHMKVFTDKPALQLYSGNWLAGTPNRSGGSYNNYAGLALETQFSPDSPNHPEWQEPCILQPGQIYAYTTIYQFDILQTVQD